MADTIFGFFLGVLATILTCGMLFSDELKHNVDVNKERKALCEMWQYELKGHHPTEDRFQELVRVRPEGCGPRQD